MAERWKQWLRHSWTDEHSAARRILLLAADAALTPDEMRELAGKLWP